MNSTANLELRCRTSTDTWRVQGDCGDRRSVGNGASSISTVIFDTTSLAVRERADHGASGRNHVTAVDSGLVTLGHSAEWSGHIAGSYSRSEVGGDNCSGKVRSHWSWRRNIGSSWVGNDGSGELEDLEVVLDQSKGEVESEHVDALLNDGCGSGFGETAGSGFSVVEGVAHTRTHEAQLHVSTLGQVFEAFWSCFTELLSSGLDAC